MRRHVVVLAAVLGATPASASPLGVLWDQNAKCPAQGNSIKANAGLVAWIDNRTLVRRVRATGKALPAVKLEAVSPQLQQLDDTFAIVRDPRGFAVLDVMTGKQLWRRNVAGSVAERVAADVGGAVATIRVGNGKHAKRELELVDARTGKGAGVIELPTTDPVRFLGAGPSLVFVIQRGIATTVSAYTRAETKLAWTSTIKSTSSSAVASAVGDELVVATDNAVVWFDAKGASTSQSFELPSIQAVSNDHVYVMIEAARKVIALDRNTHKPVWSAKRNGIAAGAVVLASANLYIRDEDQLVELDAKTGAPVAQYGVAGAWTYGFGGAPALFACDGKHLVALDTSAKDVALETATVTGRVRCKACTPDQQYWVRIGDAKVAADDKGKFALQVTGRGKLHVVVQFVENIGVLVSDYSLADHDLEFTGKSTYDLGTLVVVHEQEGD